MPVIIRDVDVVVDPRAQSDASAGADAGGAPQAVGRLSGDDLQRAMDEIAWRRGRLAAD